MKISVSQEKWFSTKNHCGVNQTQICKDLSPPNSDSVGLGSWHYKNFYRQFWCEVRIRGLLSRDMDNLVLFFSVVDLEYNEVVELQGEGRLFQYIGYRKRYLSTTQTDVLKHFFKLMGLLVQSNFILFFKDIIYLSRLYCIFIAVWELP